MRVATIRYIALTVYALALSVWSGNIIVGAGGSWLAGAVPVVGWFNTVASHDLWTTTFALLVALWTMCIAAVVVLRSWRKG